MVFSDGMFSMIFSAWYFQPGLCSYESETKFVVAVAVAAGRMPLGASIWVAGLHRSPSHRAAWPTGPFRFYVALPSLVHGYCWKHRRWIRSFTSSAENVHIFDAYCILWNNDKFYGLIRPILCMLDVATIEATAWEKKLKGGTELCATCPQCWTANLKEAGFELNHSACRWEAKRKIIISSE